MKIKKQFFALIVLFVSISIFGQKKLEPTIIILSPNETKYDKYFEKEINQYNSAISLNQNATEAEAYLKSDDFLSQPENIQLIIKSEIEFAENLDFFKSASSISAQFLAYRFFEKFPNLLIIPKDQKSDGSLNDLKSKSENNKFQYVLNFSEIELYKKEHIGYAKIKVQLFDGISNSIILNESYIGDWNNPGFEFSCTNQSINCTINNALSKALNDIVYTIAINSPTLIKEKQLSEERFNILSNQYLNNDFDEQFLKSILKDNNDKPFQVLLNNDKTKFVAFFIEQVSSQGFKELTKNKKDKNVKIISPNDIKDKEFLEEIPRTYAYIIKAVKHNDEWYYEKSNVTYFQANSISEGEKQYFNNLQQWNFFKENSTELNPDFWETQLFKKVSDLKKDPDWDNYGDNMWMSDEINNREYVGFYEIVANSLRKENKEENSKFEKSIKKQVFEIRYQKLKENQPDKYSKISEHSLIYSNNRKLAINPVLVTNKEGVKTLRYFVAFDNSNELYEWIYFEPLIIKSDLFGSDVVDQIGSLTDWNFSVNNLNDEIFWNQYVMQKEGNDFKYLKKMNE
jgi:hypothetical protein